jgi:protein SCO1/2
VSFTVDPERDTPEVMRKFAEGYGADAERWFWLTGTWPVIDELVRDRFHLTAKKDPEATPGFEVLHDLRMVLVDRAGQIRGYYIAATSDYRANEGELAQLRADVEKLLKSGE